MTDHFMKKELAKDAEPMRMLTQREYMQLRLQGIVLFFCEARDQENYETAKQLYASAKTADLDNTRDVEQIKSLISMLAQVLKNKEGAAYSQMRVTLRRYKRFLSFAEIHGGKQ